MSTLRNKYHELGNKSHTACLVATDLEEMAVELKKIIKVKDISKNVNKIKLLVQDMAKHAGIINSKVTDNDVEMSNLRDIIYRLIDPDIDLQIHLDKIKEENKKIKILIVDDEKIIAESLSKKYRNEGYQIDFALNADDAISKVDQFMPNILMTDIYFPGEKNGLDLIKYVKDKMKWVQILVVSRLDDENVKKEIKDLGVEEILKKPVKYAQINAKISGMIQTLKR